jgi:hypothetical protein
MKMKVFFCFVSVVLGSLDLFAQNTAPAINIFPTGSSNAVYTHHLLRSKTVYAVLLENVPGVGQLTRSSQTYTITNITASTIDTEIRGIGYVTAQLAVTVPVSSQENVFDIRITVVDADNITRLSIAASFNLVINPILGFWMLPSDNDPQNLPLYLVKAGTESYAPQILVFNDYPDMTNVVMRFTDANGVFVRNGRVQRNSLAITGWYDSANNNDAAFSIKGQKDAFDQLESDTKLLIPLKTITNGYFGEIVITRTNANGAFVERYRLEDGSRIVAPTSLTLSITNSLPTVRIVTEPLSRVAVEYATNTFGLPIWLTATNMIVLPDGTGIHQSTSTALESLRLYRLRHW